jgi:hypothetical protein
VDTLKGLRGTYSNGVFFTEQSAPQTHVRKMLVSVDLERSDANITEMKRRLARKVVDAGGNALVTFTYSRATAMMGWGDGMWRGSGYIAKL